MLDPVLISKIGSLELRARRIVEGTVVGRHSSPYHGFSIEFAEHRNYAPGDDPRYLDWKLHAKTDRFHLKQFEEETNLAAHLFIDASESMSFQSEAAPWSKFECARTLAAAAAHLVIRGRDAVGLAIFDSQVRTRLAPSSKRNHLNQVLQTLAQQRPEGQTSTGSLLHELAGHAKQRGVVMLFSDLFDDPREIDRGLRRLAHRRHDVRLVQIIDPAEIDFPFDEATLFQGMESAPNVTIDAGAIRKAYRKEFEAHRRAITATCRDAGIAYQLVRTTDPPDQALRRLLDRSQRSA